MKTVTKTRRGGKTTIVKTTPTRNELRYQQKKMQNSLDRATRKEIEKTKRVEYIATNAQLAAQGLSAGMNVGSAVRERERTIQQQNALLLPEVGKSNDSNSTSNYDSQYGFGDPIVR